MAIKRPTPKKLSVEAQAAITQASAEQTGKTVKVKSYDKNFPVFDTPINQKVLVYIPNHTLQTPDGSTVLRMDKFAAHPILDGRSYGDVRCTNGIISDELGLNGSCPLCDGMAENWELYNFQYADVAASKGIAVDSPEAADALKQDRVDLVRAMSIKAAEVWYTFPIVVIQCEEKDGQMTVNPKKDADGRITGIPMWYSIRERTFKEKWEAGYDSIDLPDGPPTSPAGLWAILNFTYQPKNGNPDKMGSARALKVTFKPMEGYGEWASYFDKLTEDWTPAKAQEVVVLDAVRDMDEMNEVADTLLKPVRDKLSMYKIAGARKIEPPVGVGTDADSALASFGATPATPATPNVATPPVATPPVATPPTTPITSEVPNAGIA